jgi:hypothetical protein
MEVDEVEVVPVKEWREVSPAAIALESAAGLAAIAAGGYLMARYRRRLFPLWAAATASWFTLCKYLICTRCEHYGRKCEFYNLGVLAARMFPAQPDRTLTQVGYAAEGLSMGGMMILPLTAAWGDKKRFAAYATLFAAQYGTQLLVSCRHCARTATTPWKARCPSYQLARRIWVNKIAAPGGAAAAGRGNSRPPQRCTSRN